MSNYGCPSCDETTIGRCAHCGTVRFALPRTLEKDALMSPSQGEECCGRCGRHHGIGGVYYASVISTTKRAEDIRQRIDAIIDADRRTK